jgi:peptidoglycan/xylan/chitin deacetylase (PgdA/CDA1 family)
MKPSLKRSLVLLLIALAVIALAIVVFSVFFDQAFLVKRGTISRGNTDRMLVALTFDDGPSSEWTPRLLDELKNLDVKATFFVLGAHVKSNPELARRIVREGHEIENHSYDHDLFVFRATSDLKRDIRDCEATVRDVTGASTGYFRPPRGWLTGNQRAAVNGMGYRVVLWSLNSKDWVTFDDKYVVRHILRKVRPGDIILFHDGGGIFGTDGRNRDETIKTIVRLVPKLRQRGYRLVTLAELLDESKEGGH